MEAAADDLHRLFSLFGKAAPDLWLVVARAGAFMAAVMVFKVAATLTRLLTGGPTGIAEAGDLRARIGAVAPGVFAGLVAAATLVLSGGFSATTRSATRKA